jgi:hypothetical protein
MGFEATDVRWNDPWTRKDKPREELKLLELVPTIRRELQIEAEERTK